MQISLCMAFDAYFALELVTPDLTAKIKLIY